MDTRSKELSVEYVISAIELIACEEPATQEELVAVEARCLQLMKYISNSSTTGEVPHEAWHFLMDADIRFKSPEYAETTRRLLAETLPRWQAENAKDSGGCNDG